MKTLLALALALFLVIVPIAPAQAIQDTCINLNVQSVPSVCLPKTPIDPLIEPLIPPVLREPVSPSKPPTSRPGTKPHKPTKSASKSDTSRPNPKPTPRAADAEIEKKKANKDKAKKPDTVTTTEPAVERQPRTVYEFKTYPWYFWFTIIFTLLGVGWLLFYDTDPDTENKSIVDNLRRRVLK